MGRPNRGRMEKLLTIRVSAEEQRRVHEAAARAGVTVADWARGLLLADAARTELGPEHPTAERPAL